MEHGKWFISSDGYYPYCSRCLETPEGGKMTRFCANCGAQMDADVVEHREPAARDTLKSGKTTAKKKYVDAGFLMRYFDERSNDKTELYERAASNGDEASAYYKGKAHAYVIARDVVEMCLGDEELYVEREERSAL